MTQTELQKLASKFPSEVAFVPCGRPENLKAPIASAVNWEKGIYNVNNLDFNFSALGLLLGSDYFAIDLDGASAISLFEFFNLGLPETLTISSNPGVRQALIFKQNPACLVAYQVLKTGDKEQLELRTGKQYQIIGGLHPSGKPYQSNEFYDIPQLEVSQIKSLQKLIDKKISSDADDAATHIEFDGNNEHLLKLSSLIYKAKQATLVDWTAYEDWLKMGMICHSVDESEECLKLWSNWSRSFKGYEKTPDDVYEEKWHSFKGKKNGLSIGSLYYSIFGDKKQSGDNEISKDDLEDESSHEYVNAFNSLLKKTKKGLAEPDKALDEVKGHAINYLQTDIAAANLSNQTTGGVFGSVLGYFRDNLLAETLSDKEKILARASIKEINDSSVSNFDFLSLVKGSELEPVYKQFLESISNSNIAQAFANSLVSFSSVLPKNLRYNSIREFTVSPSLFLLNVGGATSGKDLLMSAWNKPLISTALKVRNSYIQKEEEYQDFLTHWDSLKKAGDKKEFYQSVTGNCEDKKPSEMRDEIMPKPEVPHPYVLVDSSFEQMTRISGKQKTFGLLLAPSEIADLLDTQNNIGGNKASALNRYINVWNNGATMRDRVLEKPEAADSFQVSIQSSIQTGRFHQFFNTEDPSGIMSRFNFIQINKRLDIADDVIGEKKVLLDLSKILEEFYLKAQTVVQPGFVKKPDAITLLWQAFKAEINERAEDLIEINPGFHQWLRRLAEQVARYALNIHAMRFTLGLETDMYTMSVTSMQGAIELGRFFLGQAKSVFNQPVLSGIGLIPSGKLRAFNKLLETAKGKPLPLEKARSYACCRNKEIVELYGDKNDKALRKDGIARLFLDAERHGIGKYNQERQQFEPHPDLCNL